MNPATASTYRLELRGLTKQYGSGGSRMTAVEPLDMVIDDDSSIGIVGESGSGKSTLAKLIVGMERPTDGAIFVNGNPLSTMLNLKGVKGRREYRRHVQYVPQDTSSSFDPLQTVRESVAMPLRMLRGMRDEREIDAKLDEVAVELDLQPSLYDRHPYQLSGGQRQRFALARSLVVEPRILLCDEVISALDVSVQGQVLNLIKTYVQRHRMGLIFVSHGLPATAFIARELLVMQSGSVVEHGSVGTMIDHPQHPYTHQLLRAYEGAGVRRRVQL